MVVAAKKVCLKFEEVLVEAYQITSNEQEQLLLTHRQIGESIGKSKETAQRFLKQHQNDFPEPILAKIPDRPRPVALTPIETAVNYWKSQADAGNSTAKTLIAAFDSIEIATNNSEPHITTEDTTPKSELQLIAEGIEIASQWMKEAGIEPGAIASWRLNELAKQVPSLSQINTSAQALIAQSLPTPSGTIPSQLAEQLSLLTERKITAAQVNKALHELELQDWANPGKNRERKLTEAGKQYGIALLTTSADGWQGAQLRWFESVIPLLHEHLKR
jgi:hypothetical protein